MENNLIIDYDINFNDLDGGDFAEMFHHSLNDWMNHFETRDEMEEVMGVEIE